MGDTAAGRADAGALDAGAFGPWLDAMAAALDGTADADVPCGTCTACCRSSQFVHVGPEETTTIARIPAALLFPAPGMPKGHLLMGYDEHGRCPMLGQQGCTIYDHRPRTCRVYDCRVFPAAGVAADDDKPAIAAQARRWVFTHATDEDRARHDTVRAAAAAVPPGEVVSRTHLAVRAVRTVIGR